VGEQKKMGRDSGELGRKTSNSPEDLTVSLGRAAAVHCFPSCRGAELGFETTQLPQVLASHVRNEKSAWNG
jgi:hypothetical protein